MLPPASTAHGSPEVTDARSPSVFFISNRLDYRNGTLIGNLRITDQLIQRLRDLEKSHTITTLQMFFQNQHIVLQKFRT